MPELPDVEGYRRYLKRHAQGKRIVRVDAPDAKLVRNTTPQALHRAIKGHHFGEPRRHGKWLIAPVDHTELLLHFGMTGDLRWSQDASDRQPHDRVIFVVEGGELRYNDLRRFGGVWLARDERERDAITGPLGPDAAQIDRDTFEALLKRRRGGVKAALMDQHFVAGVGNLLSDEILWRARIHPGTDVRRLGPERRRRLYEAMRDVVRESSRSGHVPQGSNWLMNVRSQRDARCPRDGTPLRRGTYAGRTAVWCPKEQRL
jgi:formamidopyrimidine-DNA glycosylase